jgi:hypothetical protein
MHRTLDQLDHDLELTRRGELMLDDASDRLRRARGGSDAGSGDCAAPVSGGRVVGRLAAVADDVLRSAPRSDWTRDQDEDAEIRSELVAAVSESERRRGATERTEDRADRPGP